MPPIKKPEAEILAKNQKLYEHLQEVRKSKTVTLKPTPMLRSEILALDGTTQPFRLRYYQSIGIYHLIACTRMLLGDACGLGKTVEVIGALCYLWEKCLDTKVIVVAPKSALRQWSSELQKFAHSVTPYVLSGTPTERADIYKAFQEHATGPGLTTAVLVTSYHILVRDWNAGAHRPLLPNGQPDPKAIPTPGLVDQLTAGLKAPIVVFDEATAFKSPRTKTWQVASQLSARASRCWALTATPIKNKLEEAYSIFKVVCPNLFTNMTRFMADFCVTKLQSVGGRRKIPIVVGYKNLEAFRIKIDPFYLGRAKHMVSDELPKLITKEITVELTPVEDKKYEEALSGVLSLGDGEVKDYEEHKAFVALTYCQQVVDSLTLLKYEAGDLVDTDVYCEESAEVEELGSKEGALLDLIQEEFDDEKVIVYTRFASLVPRLQGLLTKAGVENVAITGAVVDTAKNPARQNAMKAFQDLNSKVKVIIITDAGSEAINLQAASAIIFYDSPWSWGNYVQLLGRPIRIGSPHPNVVAVHIIAERPGKTKKDRKTIDHHTLSLLQKKKDLVDKVLGESAVGALDFGKDSSFIKELVKKLGVKSPSSV